MTVVAIMSTDDFLVQMEAHLREYDRQLSGVQLEKIHRKAVQTFGINGINVYLEEYQMLMLKWMQEDGYQTWRNLTRPWSIRQIKHSLESPESE